MQIKLPRGVRIMETADQREFDRLNRTHIERYAAAVEGGGVVFEVTTDEGYSIAIVSRTGRVIEHLEKVFVSFGPDGPVKHPVYRTGETPRGFPEKNRVLLEETLKILERLARHG